MLEPIMEIVRFVGSALWHIWPYLLITIPLAVAVQMMGISRHITGAFQARPLVAIFLATVVGAFSPFCSCSVIPMVATLLMGGVPLAPVMSFWLASPSMDPEIFFLSVATIGWQLAIWRLAATFALSLSAGLLTHYAGQQGWLGTSILRRPGRSPMAGLGAWLQERRRWAGQFLAVAPRLAVAAGVPVQPATELSCSSSGSACDGCAPPATTTPACAAAPEDNSAPAAASFRRRLLEETWDATLMVGKFMVLAFTLEALIVLYVPEAWIAGLMGGDNSWAILAAALIGIPVYTSNLAALPMIGGLLAKGMDPATALAFLIAGPITTIPAMAAVWGVVSRRVFALYLACGLLGAVGAGYLYHLVAGLPGYIP